MWGAKNSTFALPAASKTSGNQEKAKGFTDAVQPAQWRRNHGVEKRALKALKTE